MAIVTNWRDAFQLVENTLNSVIRGEINGIPELTQQDKIAVEYLTTLDGYKLVHPRGVYGILFQGSKPSKDDRIKSNSLFMKEDLIIGVVSIIRFIYVKDAAIDLQPKLPMEYAELAIKALSGIEIENNRPEYERKIYPLPTELVDETDGVWKYLTPFVVPRDFKERTI